MHGIGSLMSKKKSVEMAFKEFFEKVKKKGLDREEVESTKQWMLNALRSEGFTDEQINDMKMQKVWKFILDNVTVVVDQATMEIGMALQQRIMTPQQLQILSKFAKDFTAELESMVEELERELEEKQKEKKRKK